MSSEIFFDQVEQNIVALINEKKLRLAHDKCLSWIQKFPDEKRFERLKERIEKEVENENRDYVKIEIEKNEELIDKEEYAKAIENLQNLLKLTEDTSKIERLIIKAQEKYQKKAKKVQEEFEKQQRERLDRMFEENPDMLIPQLFMMERENPGNKLVLGLTSEYRSRIIRKKIKDKSELLKSEKYNDINHFIEDLKKIDKDDPQIEEVVRQIKIRQHEKQVDQQREHIYESEKQLVTLMQLKKYSKAIRVAEEILNMEPSNKEVAGVLKKAQSEFFKQTKEETVKKMEENAPKLKSEYESDKDSFVRI